MTPVPLQAWGPRTSEARPARTGNGRQRPEPEPHHVGLWLDRMLAEPWSKEERGWRSRSELYRAAVDALTPGPAGGESGALTTYRQLFRRYLAAVTAPKARTAREVVELEATSRVLLHTAAGETVTEGTLLFHHTYGVPYLPGSALKGVARARLLTMAERASDERRREQLRRWADDLLGFVRETPGGRLPASGSQADPRTQASLVEFLDALWLPPEGQRGEAPLALDIVNPHHPRYYTVQEGDRVFPTDGDSPIPVERLSVAPRASFLLIAEAPEDLGPWLTWLVDDVLLPALEEDGLGGWTSAGYGRFRAARTNRHRPPPAPTRPEWGPAHVVWIPGKSELAANLAGGKRAFARGDAARELLRGLPEEVRDRLVKRREMKLEVALEAEGASLRLAALRPLSS